MVCIQWGVSLEISPLPSYGVGLHKFLELFVYQEILKPWLGWVSFAFECPVGFSSVDIVCDPDGVQEKFFCNFDFHFFFRFCPDFFGADGVFQVSKEGLRDLLYMAGMYGVFLKDGGKGFFMAVLF